MTTTARYRNLYAKLLRLYPKPYRERFGEEMEQTFNDLCRERREAGGGLFGFVLWVFAETSAGIIRENITVALMQNITRRLMVWAVVVALVPIIPLVAMQFTSEVNWTLRDFVSAGSLLFGSALVYELATNTITTRYRVAVGVAVMAAFLYVWVNLLLASSRTGVVDLTCYFLLAVGITGRSFCDLNRFIRHLKEPGIDV